MKGISLHAVAPRQNVCVHMLASHALNVTGWTWTLLLRLTISFSVA